MDALPVRAFFQRGYAPADYEQIRPNVLDDYIENRLQQSFDDGIRTHALSVSRDGTWNEWINIMYVAYVCLQNRIGPNAQPVYDGFILAFYKNLIYAHNATRPSWQRSLSVPRARTIAREIVENMSTPVWNYITIILPATTVLQNTARIFLARLELRRLRRERASIILQTAFRQLIARRLLQRLQDQHNMGDDAKLVAAQGRNAAFLREAFKTEPFYGNSMEEVYTFVTSIHSLMNMNGYTHNLQGHDAARRAGWLLQYQREVLAITLNFRGQAAIWWNTARQSTAGPPVYLTPYTWGRDTYTHPNAVAVGGPGGDVLHLGLHRLILARFATPAPSAQPNYRTIDWSAIRFSGKANEIDLFNQTVKAIATQHNLPWNPLATPPQQLPIQHGAAIISGIAARFTGAAAEWWTQLRTLPTQIQVTPGPGSSNGLLNIIEKVFRSKTHNLEQLRRLQSLKWDQKVPLVEFNVEFDQIRRNAQQSETPENKHILIDYYLQTLPIELADCVQDHLDTLITIDENRVNLLTVQNLAIQKNNTQILKSTKLQKNKDTGLKSPKIIADAAKLR